MKINEKKIKTKRKQKKWHEVHKGQRKEPNPDELILIEITRILHFRKGNEFLITEKKGLQRLWKGDMIQ